MIILTGPTAVGKTQPVCPSGSRCWRGDHLRGFHAGIQPYGYRFRQDPTKEEMDDIPHYLIDVLDPGRGVPCGPVPADGKRGHGKNLRAGERFLFLTGGTGFYIQAVVNDIDFTETRKKSPVRQQLEQEAGRGKRSRLAARDASGKSTLSPP